MTRSAPPYCATNPAKESRRQTSYTLTEDPKLEDAHMQVSSGQHAEWPSFPRDDQHVDYYIPSGDCAIHQPGHFFRFALWTRQALTGA